MAAETSRLLLTFPKQDSQSGVSRPTLHVLATRLGISECDVIHLALSRMLRADFSAYAPDDGPLSAEEIAALRSHSSAVLPRSKVISRRTLF